MDVKLICLDMDGTLFADNRIIPEINIRALRAAIQRGIKVALVSGRNYRFLGNYAAQIDPNVILVSSNGSRIDESVNGRCLYECTFDAEEYMRVSRAVWNLGLYFEVYTGDINYVFRQNLAPERQRRALNEYIQNRFVLGAVSCDAEPAAPIRGAYKLVAFSNDPSEIDCARSKLDIQHIFHCSSSARNIEIMPHDSGKGAAVKKLSELFDIPLAQTMAFGDYTNDLDMIRTAGHGVAMENGVDILKAAAEIIAPKNTNGGVGQVIFKYVLNEVD